MVAHTNAAWVGTGYGTQCRTWAPRWARLGHKVVISAFWGLNGASTEWNGHLVLPGGQDPYGSDILASHARYVKADLVLTLMDVWPINADQIRSIRTDLGIPVAHWMPVDCDRPHDIDVSPGVSVMDERHLKHTGAIPVAMSRFGQAKLAEAGLDALYVPHGIEATRVFTPERRAEAREALGLGDRFVVAMNAANKDAIRKGFPEALLAFARFRKRHPEALLMLHALTAAPGALDLQALCNRLGISDAVRWADQYAYLTGLLQPEMIAAWMSAADVGMHASYGEGFGLAGIEFQSCGTPIITTDATAMTELAGPGWMVRGQEFWNMAHQSWWTKPLISHTCPQCGYEEGIDAALEAAWQAREDGSIGQLRVKSREFALQYDADRVLTEYWEPALEQIMERANAGWSAGVLPAPGTGRLASDDERDAVVSAVASLYNDGAIGAAEFAGRAAQAMQARVPAELAGLTDLPAAA